MATTNMTVKVSPNDKGNPPGKLADAEVHFTGGPLEGLKLIGFAIWETRSGARRNVTFPARQYSVNGERRSFALLRFSPRPTSIKSVRKFTWEGSIEYTLNGGSYQRYIGTFTVSTGTAVTYRAVDVNGNVEATHALTG